MTSELVLAGAQPREGAPKVPAASVSTALADARSRQPTKVHRTVALAVARGSEKTAKLRLERLARVVLATGGDFEKPDDVWAADWSTLNPQAVEVIDAGIREAWSGAASTRNAMRDSLRAVIREGTNAGVFTTEQERRLLNACRPEQEVVDEEKQARGHLKADRVAKVFADLAKDSSLVARRDAALIALLVGAGLRRAEAVALNLSDVDEHRDSLVVRGKGGKTRTVPLAPGVRRAILAWLKVRGDEPGPLLTPITVKKPQTPILGRRLSTNTVAYVVERRFGPDVKPHDLRRTFTGDLLDSGADLSVASAVLGHGSPATTARYDRRGHEARRAAVEKLSIPFVEVEP